MVLIDAVAGDQDTRLFSLLPPGRIPGFGDERQGIDSVTLNEGCARLRAARLSLGNRPLVVLTRGEEKHSPEPWVSSELSPLWARTWQEIQRDLPNLSSNSVQVVAEGSRHDIEFDAPDLVIAAIREVVTSARTGAPVRQSAVAPSENLER
jgi:hypothetical protein